MLLVDAAAGTEIEKIRNTTMRGRIFTKMVWCCLGITKLLFPYKSLAYRSVGIDFLAILFSLPWNSLAISHGGVNGVPYVGFNILIISWLAKYSLIFLYRGTGRDIFVSGF
jgi:hypothetical protein